MPFVYNNEIKIHYDIIGDRDKPPLLLLHWFMGNMETFHDTNYVRMLKPHFQLILIDHRGYGQSSKPYTSSSYDLKNHVDDIVLLLDELEIEKVHLLGYSMGGRISFAMAQYEPDRIISMVIGGMHHYGNIPTDIDERIQLLEQGIDAILKAYNIGPASVRNKMKKNDVKALIADTKQTRKWKTLDLENYNGPILLFVGKEDPFYEGAKQASKEMRKITFVAFENETHRSAFVKRHLLKPHLSRFYKIKL